MKEPFLIKTYKYFLGLKGKEKKGILITDNEARFSEEVFKWPFKVFNVIHMDLVEDKEYSEEEGWHTHLIRNIFADK